MQKLIERANILIEALPYIRKFYGKTVVIKYGGAAMEKKDLKEDFASDIVLLKYVGINPIVVHGGGPQIGEILKRLGRKSEFVEGMRVTDALTMEVVEMVLVGRINKEIVSSINQKGGSAVGLSGKDGGLIVARKLYPEAKGGAANQTDLGFVGEVELVRPAILDSLDENNFIPVIAPVGVDSEGQTLNVNADLVAGKIAIATAAAKLIYLSDVEGVKGKEGPLIATLTSSQARELIQAGTIEGGMIPKVRCCLEALEAGVAKTHIIDGRVKHAVLLEIFTDRGIGTEIVQE